MKRIACILVLCSGAAMAQDVLSDDMAVVARRMEIERRSQGRAQAKAAQMDKRRLEFYQLVTDFTNAWTALMESEKNGEWSPKKAKAVRRAFDRLVHSEGWLEAPQ